MDEERLKSLPDRIDIRHGNFFNFDSEKFKDNFGERQPDVAIIMWHTLGFAGDLPRMKHVLKNAFDILRPGGRIFIEMPDRNFGCYARAIRDFHDANPDLPFGAIKDAPSVSAGTEQNEDKATWRYFPKNSEIEEALSSAGFDVNIDMINSYFVTAEANQSTKLLIKENMFFAEKPLNERRQQIMLDYSQKLPDEKPNDEVKIEEIRDQIKAA